MSIESLRTDWLLAFKNLFFPIYCQECGERLLTEDNGYFCPTCWEQSPRITRPYCTGCGKPHEAMVGLGTQNNFPCNTCRDKPNKKIHRIYGTALYDGAIGRAIRLMKFNGKLRLAAPLVEEVLDWAQREMEPERYDLLVPVPLYPVRERMRGFNQSRLLAEGILPLFTNARLDESLSRIRPTRTQSSLKGRKRRDNVRGAFAVIGDTCIEKHILLIDDVVTSSGTVTECAAALLRGGAIEVDVLSIALATKRTRWDRT